MRRKDIRFPRRLVRSALKFALALLLACGLFPAPGAMGQGAARGTIAFVANLDGNWDLFVMTGNGADPVRLTSTPVDERAPALSPDNKQIAYATSDGALSVMTLATKATTQIPLPAGRYAYPTWLSDGSGIVYTAYKFAPPSEDADLFVYSFKDGKPRPFLTQTGLQDYPALSPSGDRLAYMSSLTTVIPDFGASIAQQLWVASLTDGKTSPLLLGGTSNTRPAWSPDGKWIAFSSDRGGNTDIWRMNVEGRDLQRVTGGPAAETHPAWSPDGREIAYVSTESGRQQISVIDVKTRVARRLSPFGSRPIEIKDPHWR